MIRKFKSLSQGIIVVIVLLGFSSLGFSESWSIEGEYFEGCTCNPGCPCLFGSIPSHNNTCKISGVFNIRKGNYGQQVLDGQTVIGITDLTAKPDKNWIVFYINSVNTTTGQRNALLDIFKNHVFGFAKVPSKRITVKYLPIQVKSTVWQKKATAANNLTLDVEILRGSGASDKPTQIVNKSFPIWADEFDLELNMGKANTHRFYEGDRMWNYDGRSGFATNFQFTGN